MKNQPEYVTIATFYKYDRCPLWETQEGTEKMHEMGKGMVHLIYGPGKGKSASALGLGVMGALAEKKVIMVQFLKGVLEENGAEILKRLEPEMKVFRFERSHGLFEDLTEQHKQEEIFNLKNGFNFARKVMTTGGCDILILDEVLGLVDMGVISKEEFIHFLEMKDSEMELVMTGTVCPKEIEKYVDRISYVDNVKADSSKE